MTREELNEKYPELEGVLMHRHPLGGGWVSDDSDVDQDSFVDSDSVVADGSTVEIRSIVTSSTVIRSRVEGGSVVNSSMVDGTVYIPPAGAEEGFLRILDANPGEVPALRKALMEGEINGSAYEGACCCLIGTIAKAKGCSYKNLDPDAQSPEERMFQAIRPGQKPGSGNVGSMAAKLAVEWIDQWTEKK